jgi:trehalose synthase
VTAAIPQRVRLRRKALESYRPVVGDDTVADIRDRAADLRGLRVLELSSTATGGGVAELLASLVPLERDLGLEAEWHVIAGQPGFFGVTKRIHNGLQGMDVELSDDERERFLKGNRLNARGLERGWDVVIVHDPQPVAIRSLVGDLGARWLWRCHVDSSAPNMDVWEYLRPFVEAHDEAVFTLPDFVPPDLALPTRAVPPAIDPLSSKNRELPHYLARETVEELGVDLSSPLLLQVSRFDPWKDPLGVVAVWRKAREEFPPLQLALVGSMAGDDPEAWSIYSEIERETDGEPGAFLFTDRMGVGHHEVNSLQRVADVAIQKSIREGFGLIVSETLWKGTPMVAGRAGGIPLQLEAGVNGLLATTNEEFCNAVCKLLSERGLATQLGAAGRARVHDRFLMPRLLADQLSLLTDLVGGKTA